MRLSLIILYTIWNISMSYAQMAPREYFKFAKYNYDNNEYQAALNMLDKAINTDPQYVNAYYLRAEVKYSLGNYQSALLDIDHVISQDNEDNTYYPDYLLLRGKLYRELDHKNLAVIDLNKSILLSSTQAEAYFERARIKKERNFTGSVSDMNNAILINPDNPEYYAVRAQIKRDFYHPNYESSKYESILIDIDKAITLSSEYFDYYKFRNRLYIESGHKNRALKDLNNMVIKFPDQQYGYEARALIRMKDAFYKNAIIDYNQAIKLSPNDDKNYRYRGLCYHNIGFYHKARKDFTKAIEILSKKISNEDYYSKRKANELGIGKGLLYYKKFCERY